MKEIRADVFDRGLTDVFGQWLYMGAVEMVSSDRVLFNADQDGQPFQFLMYRYQRSRPFLLRLTEVDLINPGEESRYLGLASVLSMVPSSDPAHPYTVDVIGRLDEMPSEPTIEATA